MKVIYPRDLHQFVEDLVVAVLRDRASHAPSVEDYTLAAFLHKETVRNPIFSNQYGIGTKM